MMRGPDHPDLFWGYHASLLPVICARGARQGHARPRAKTQRNGAENGMSVKLLLTFSLLGLMAITTGCISSAVYSRNVERLYPTETFVDVDGIKMHVLERGETGPVILMIHGASANARDFDWTLAPRLSDDHRVIIVDRPGHGYSERPSQGYSLERQAGLIAGTVKALAPGEQVVVLGHSFGGAVALRLTLDHPEIVNGLVLLTPASHEWGGGGMAWYYKYATHPLIGPFFNQLVPFVGPGQTEAGLESVFSPEPVPSEYYDNSAVGLLFRPENFRANAEDFNNIEAELAGQQARYSTIDIPVTIFSGSQDEVIDPRLHAGRLKHQIQDINLIPLPTTGHRPDHSQTDDIVSVLKRYAGSAQNPINAAGQNNPD